jgi:hypothetical protein
MRKLIQFFNNRFGSQHNRTYNLLVSEWYSAIFTLNEIDVSLRDVSEDVVVSRLTDFIDSHDVTIDELQHVAVIPKLSANAFDMDIKLIAKPLLLVNRLQPYLSLELGFWGEHDDVTIKGPMEHIGVVSGKAGDTVGVYLNGTLEDGGLFSFVLMGDELKEALNLGINAGLNGVRVSDALMMDMMLNAVLKRMFDSDIGFHLGDHVDVSLLQDMVQLRQDNNEDGAGSTNVYATWGQVIGKKLRLFDVSDRLTVERAEKEELSKTGKLKLISDNGVTKDDSESKPKAVSKIESTEVAEEDVEWGKF